MHLPHLALLLIYLNLNLTSGFPNTAPLPPSSPHHNLPQPTQPAALDLRQAPTPAAPPAPGVTAPPSPDTAPGQKLEADGGDGYITGVDPYGRTYRFRQTTYYSCVDWKTTTHCGWHRPLIEAGAGSLRGNVVWVVGVAVVVAVLGA